MAMTKCKECGTDISTKADACPKCGAKQVRTSGCAKFALGAIIFFVLVSILGQCSRTDSPSRAVSASPPATPASSVSGPSQPAAPSAPIPGSQWVYDQQTDPMKGGETLFAMVQSTNTVNFDFPYQGAQHATLTLRTHPRHGKDVILKIERGQFLCRSYEDCNVLVRFDENEPVTFSGVGASDNSSEMVFLRNYSRFVAGMLKAKRVRMSAEVYQEGSPVFEFDVSDFSDAKYKGGQ